MCCKALTGQTVPAERWKISLEKISVGSLLRVINERLLVFWLCQRWCGETASMSL